jgi:4-hydroxyphenylpyruvate dioxygenase-like putative hemolysin
MNNGNVEPYRGFGHIAFNCNSVDETCEKLESQGYVFFNNHVQKKKHWFYFCSVRFHKRPNEGRMKVPYELT